MARTKLPTLPNVQVAQRVVEHHRTLLQTTTTGPLGQTSDIWALLEEALGEIDLLVGDFNLGRIFIALFYFHLLILHDTWKELVIQLEMKRAELEAQEKVDLALVMQHTKAIQALQDFPKDYLKEFGLDAEGFIDSAKKQRDDSKQKALAKLDILWGLKPAPVGEFNRWADLPVPLCMLYGGFNDRGRIPAKVLERKPLVVVTPVCRLFLTITQNVKSMEASFEKRRLSLFKPLPLDFVRHFRLADRKRQREMEKFVRDLWFGIWGPTWVKTLEDGSFESWDEAAQRAFYDVLRDQFNLLIEQSSFSGLRVQMAVYAFHLAYKRRVKNDSFPGTIFGEDFAKAFQQIGWAGQVEQVQLYPDFEHLRRLSLKVSVEGGKVIRLSNRSLVGEVTGVPDGEWLMTDCLITVKEAHPVLKGRALYKPEEIQALEQVEAEGPRPLTDEEAEKYINRTLHPEPVQPPPSTPVTPGETPGEIDEDMAYILDEHGNLVPYAL